MVGDVPSAGVVAFAASRPAKVGAPAFGPAWASPSTGSPPSMLNAAGVKPRASDQSCIRLRPENRLMIAAFTSFASVPPLPGVGPANAAGLHLPLRQELVQGAK